MADLSDREFILSLFKIRGIEAGGDFPLNEFIEEVSFNDQRGRVFEELTKEGLLIECMNAIQLTEKGAEVLRAM